MKLYFQSVTMLTFKSHVKGKGLFLYSALSSQLDAQSATPGRPGHSDTNSASLGSILVTQQLLPGDYSPTFPPLVLI